MSLSQKHTGKVLVPWFNMAEWRQVYNMLFSQSDKNYKQALNIIKIWKSRTPLLSAGVEGTLIVLEALLTEKEAIPEHKLIDIYAISIMRFLNLCAANNQKQGSFYKSVVSNDLPKWLINVRHEIAHGHTLPSVSMLELGLQQCLEWIKIKYWQIQIETVADYTVKEDSTNSKVIEILEIFVQLNLKVLNKSIDITEYDENIIEKINDIVFKRTAQPTTDISDITSTLEEFLSDCLRKPMSEMDKEAISKTLVYKALITTEPEITVEGVHIIPKDFRNVWSNLLNILNENNFIFVVLNQLIDVTNNVELDYYVRETAALWICEILSGLQKTQLINEELNNSEKDNPDHIDRTSILKIKSIVEEKYPQYQDCLEFFSINTHCSANLQIFEDKILNTPNNYTLQFLEKVLKFNKRPENYIVDITNLVNKMLSIGPGEGSEIYTINDLENISVLNNKSINETDPIQTIVEDVNPHIGEQEHITRWKPVKDTSTYKGCPLGILPHQNKNENPQLIF